MSENPADGNTGEQAQTRERSTIRFPYNDLNDAIAVAKSLHDKRGGQCSVDELASELGHTVTSGRWRIRLAGTQQYGLITLSKQRVRLTPLGSRAIDPKTEADARVEAFLSVPLYASLYEECKGKPLPEAAGLEALMRGLGVATNQATRVRQVFARAAEQAGFFTTGRDRLVKPANSDMMEGGSGGQGPELPTDQPDEEGGSPLADPLLHGLLTRMLPRQGEKFPARDRRLLFTALAVNLNVVYGEPEDGSLDPAQVAALIKVNPSTETTTATRPVGNATANGAGPMPGTVPEAPERTTAET